MSNQEVGPSSENGPLLPGRSATPSKRRGSPLRRISLRTRLTITFAVGALALSGALASITYYTTRHTIINQTVTSDEAAAVSYSRTLEQEIPQAPLGEIATETEFPAELAAIDHVANTISMIGYSTNTFFYDSAQLDSESLPEGLRSDVLGGATAEQIFRYNNVNYLVVGISIPVLSARVGYFEVFNLASVTKTLQIVLASLLLAALVTTIAGAILGRWLAGRTLAPLRNASRAALAIANGKLDTRLDEGDESDLAVLASSFNTMVDRLQERLLRDAQFTSDVSHELRSPLTTLANSLSVMENRRDELSERAKRAFDLLSTEIHRFQRMVEELLEISRIDSGQSDYAPEVLRVGELINAAMRSVTAHPVPIELSGDIGTREVSVDKRRFERIIANLIQNADRHAGGAVIVKVDGTEELLRIAVEDAGPGVPENERERIFGRFSRGSAAAGHRGKSEGTGLGLALVYEHVALHNGRVWVEDRQPIGARFVVELPLEPRRDISDEELVESPPAGVPSPHRIAR